MQPVISCMFPQPLVTRTHPSAYDKILCFSRGFSHTACPTWRQWRSDDNIIVDEDENWWIVVSKGNNGTYLKEWSPGGLLCNDVEHKQEHGYSAKPEMKYRLESNWRNFVLIQTKERQKEWKGMFCSTRLPSTGKRENTQPNSNSNQALLCETETLWLNVYSLRIYT